MKAFTSFAVAFLILGSISIAHAEVGPDTKLSELASEKFVLVIKNPVANSHTARGDIYPYLSIEKIGGFFGLLGSPTCRIQTDAVSTEDAPEMISRGTTFESNDESKFDPSPRTALVHNRVDFYFNDATDVATGKKVRHLWLYCFDAANKTVADLEEMFDFFEIRAE